MVVYGGATGGGSLASDDLYLLNLRNGEKKAQWMIVPVVGKTPGRRYGHTIIFSKPYLLVFGGNTGTEPVNDVWWLNVDKAPFSWTLLETVGDQPWVRVYHSAALCSTGSATGMMVVFGGRTNDQTALKDSWGLRRHRDGRWDWVKAPYKPGVDEPISRYQHSTAFIGPLMLVIGGRTDTVGETVSLEVYDTESSEWRKFPSIQRFRHAWFCVDTQLFMHGGFDNESPTVPTDAIMKLDAVQVLKSVPLLLDKIEGLFGASSPGVPSSPSTPGSAHGGVSGKSTPTEKEGGIILKKPQIESPDDFEEEKSMKSNKSSKAGGVEALYNLFLNHLLKPKEWASNFEGIADTEMDRFHFRSNYILALVDECQKVIEEQPMVLKIESPVKVFGDIHGQYQDLMRFFDLWGEPSEKGDIESYDYLFLGDYVDRGSHSLETIWLLMALKIKYPTKIHLLRGNHEDKWINNAFGFAEECNTRLNEDPGEPESVFNRVNELFDWLPLAAICLLGQVELNSNK